jgi:hypothetical protein
MSDINAEWREKRRWRSIKPIRNLRVGPNLPKAPIEELQQDFSADIAALRHRLRCEIATLKAELKFRRLLRVFQKYNPSQPRDEIGRWTDGGGGRSAPVRLAASDKPRLGPMAVARIAAQVAQRAIEAFRSENGLRDLFGSRIGTVSMIKIDGETIFGSNSTSPTYTDRDFREAVALRDALVAKYPDVTQTDNIGQKPNDAVFHAEANVLMRAARQNGGSLAGRTLEVSSDRPMCRSCDEVLPHIGLELGNPTVTFVGPSGIGKTMRNGVWIKP